MAISEQITLLGKGLYPDIPNGILTLKAIPTGSELDYVGGEDFYATMLDIIFPKAIEEKINFRQLLEIDFTWVCRCLRMLNYGPYYTTNAIYCPDCDKVSHGEYQVNLNSVEVKTLPDKFTNSFTISKDEFIDFDGDIVVALPTIQEVINASKDQLFMDANGEVNMTLARLCYMIKSFKGKTNLTVPEIKFNLQNTLSSADFIVLKNLVHDLTDYGLRAGGKTICPKCQSREAAFMALVDDRFFRPTLGNLRSWKADRNVQKSGGPQNADGEGRGRAEDISPNAEAKV